jgi:hypothetical protein
MKMKEMIITMSGCKQDLQVSGVSKTKKQVLEIIRQEVKEVVEHFNLEDGGWKLSRESIEGRILERILGSNFEREINQAFINEGLVIEYTGSGTLIRTREEYHPIFMNVKTGKLHVIENSDDKSYLFKFRDCDGYAYIGKL